MKRLMILFLLLSCITLQAQYRHSSWQSEKIWTPAAATTLVATGSIFTFVPSAKQEAFKLKDIIQGDGIRHWHFDDYLQYAPLAAPLALKASGLESRNSIGRMAMLEGVATATSFGIMQGLKALCVVERPDNRKPTSFPSGHTYLAFMGAELIRREFGAEYPWIAVAAYAVATTVGFMRMYNNRHWLGDVLAGAGLGMLTTSTVYWILD